ncbi:MAG: phenylalanine--tRNA ligase subunit beta [Lactobacillales bacterium]|jgi:phenylalanyl-tRNA synthetase beta chain|nr:phenylalanine--tRNA ligase subunit beta [Lactobacillales bacterium]
MLVSYKWLSELLDLSKIPASDIADKMSLTGIEVESVTRLEDGLKSIVAGRVLECVDHPDSDHLHVCQVDVGADAPSQIVCGAPNIDTGQNVIVALPGARIAGNYKIKKGKIRGFESLGMICSLEELGFSDSVIPKEWADGIYILPEDTEPGSSVFGILDMDDDIIELDVLANRPDALSMVGVAYEVGAIYNQKPEFKMPVAHEAAELKIEDFVSAKVENEDDTPTYGLRVVENVKIAASPLWLQRTLWSMGIRPINNVVDITNFILLFYGQPMHAFDYAKLGSKEILVRKASQGEKLTTLDDVERELTDADVVITDGASPIALAGVMGGESTEIDDNTTTVLLEAAVFNRENVRKTSQRFNLRSESSARFEKGINLDTVEKALDVAAAFIAKLGEGSIATGSVWASKAEATAQQVEITLTELNERIGTDLKGVEVDEIFRRLHFHFEAHEGDYVVTSPSHRQDIKIKSDIVEEVARMYGYDNIPMTLPRTDNAASLTAEQSALRKLRASFEANGLNEAITYSLTTAEKNEEFKCNYMGEFGTIALDWPMSLDHSVARVNIVSGLLEAVSYNQARKNKEVALYEIGKIFQTVEGELLPQEIETFAIALSNVGDFFAAKAVLEDALAGEKLRFEATSDFADLHPGRSAYVKIGHEIIGFIGQVHPVTAKKYDIDETYVAQINLAEVFAREASPKIFTNVGKFPSVKRDIALLVDETVTNAELVDLFELHGGKFLADVNLFDLYQGANIPAGKKSLAYGLTFVNPEATLTDEEINRAISKIEKALDGLAEVR